jgi:hypothetical protein
MTTPNPPNPVVEAGSFTCKDNGKRSLSGVAGDGIKLTVSGSKVVTVTAAGSAGTYTGCTAQDSNGVVQPCASTTVSTPGSAKLTAGGKPVLLSSDTVMTVNEKAPTGSGKATVDAGQTKLTST